MSLYAVKAAVLDDLSQRAAKAHPASRSHQAKWLRAVRFLRRRNLWVLDRDARRPTWQAGTDAA